MTDKELDDLFQKKFSDHQMPVPSDMWDRVNPQKEKRRRGAFPWWSGLGVAALVILIGTGTWIYHNSPNTKIISAVKPSTEQSKSGLTRTQPPVNQPLQTNGRTTLQSNADKTDLSSQDLSKDNKNNNNIADFYSNQKNHKNNHTTIGQQQNPISFGTNGIIEKEDSSNKSNDVFELITSSNVNKATADDQPKTFLQKSDSSAIAISKTDTAAQTPKSVVVKEKKIHSEKAPGFELMIAGYGNSRHVYDVNPINNTGLVSFGPVNQKEKVLMNSFSLTARIDKPLTKNISVKTGLQFLQTHQRVSYEYETVVPSFIVNNSGTTMLARLQSKQSLINSTYNSLNIPVLVSYHTNGAKLNVGATAGVMFNVLSWYKGRVPDAANNQAVNAKNTFRTHTGASLYAGLTASKSLGNFQLFAEPHIQYTLSSITKSSASFRQKITSYGVAIGIRKTIGK